METVTGSSSKLNDCLHYIDNLIIQCSLNLQNRRSHDRDEYILHVSSENILECIDDLFWISHSIEDSNVNLSVDNTLSDISDVIFEESHRNVPSKEHLEPLTRVNAYKWKKLNLMTGENICAPPRKSTDEYTAETVLQPETHSLNALNSSFQQLETLLLDCEGDLDALQQRAAGVSSSDPRSVAPVELSTLHAYWLELYTQVNTSSFMYMCKKSSKY